MKTGRLSRADWHFIEENADILTAQEIAKQLDRDLPPIVKYLRRIGKTANKVKEVKVQAEYDLKSRPYWKELKTQFTDEELELFVYHWKQMIAQFRKDVMATEELQIIDTIKLEILMNRSLREQQYSMTRVKQLEEELRVERMKSSEDIDREYMMNLERQIGSLMAAKEALSRDFKDLHTKKAAMYKDLKATREQRIKKMENIQSTFSGLIEKITKDPDFFEEQGKEMELMRIAVDREEGRLSEYHKYEDGEIDTPFLNCDTVMGLKDD
ncbi:MAG: hypothetical protein WAO78_11310 [Roseovarius sp.]